MRAIIIAAGMGNRCQPHTQDTPKCLLEVGETTLLDNVLYHFKQFGIQQIGVVVGHCSEKIIQKLESIEFNDFEVTFFHNDNYQNNNILHSLMYAKSFLQDDMIVSYSDIWLERAPIERLLSTSGDCVLAVDSDWQQAYIGRTLHPVSEAEKVLYDTNQVVAQLGKHLPENHKDLNVGEFIGLFKLSAKFCQTFTNIFESLNNQLEPHSDFQFSVSWEKAYITDFFNELVDRGYSLQCSLHAGDWQEIDTQEDYQNLLKTKAHRKAHAV